MTLQRQPDGSVSVRQLNAFEYNTLWELPALADPQDHAGARRRLYPPPYLKGEATPELRADWEEFVLPDLEEQLGETFARVLADLEKAVHESPPESSGDQTEAAPGEQPGSEAEEDREDDDGEEEKQEAPAPRQHWTFLIPKEHIEDWFRAMNAARLVMSSRYECHRQDMDYILKAVNSGETARLVQYELLTGLCDWWVKALMR
jgi:hypothetical protein